MYHVSFLFIVIVVAFYFFFSVNAHMQIHMNIDCVKFAPLCIYKGRRQLGIIANCCSLSLPSLFKQFLRLPLCPTLCLRQSLSHPLVYYCCCCCCYLLLYQIVLWWGYSSCFSQVQPPSWRSAPPFLKQKIVLICVAVFSSLGKQGQMSQLLAYLFY